MQSSEIEWTDMTWNPVTGCDKVSEGCRFCYAERVALKHAGEHGYDEEYPFQITERPERLDEPTKVKKPSKVFVCSMGDIFHSNVSTEFREKIHKVMEYDAPWHTYLLLTKRPGVALAYYQSTYPPKANIWVGVSCENQRRYNERVEILRQIKAHTKWVSFEPLLAEIDCTGYLWEYLYEEHGGGCVTRDMAIDAGMPEIEGDQLPSYTREDWQPNPQYHWAVIGGETGARARAMHPDHARSLIKQHNEVGVPVFFKSWGTWKPIDEDYDVRLRPGWAMIPGHDEPVQVRSDIYKGILFAKLHKRKAGNEIDGKRWQEYPASKIEKDQPDLFAKD